MKPANFYQMLEHAASVNPADRTFLRRMGDGSISGRTYPEWKEWTDALVAGLADDGLKRGDRVLFLCDPSSYWLFTNVAIITAGAITVPRATDVTEDDILYIANHAECTRAIVQNRKTKERLEKLKDRIPTLKTIHVMQDEGHNLLTGDDSLVALTKKGEVALKANTQLVADMAKRLDPESLCMIIYTSGTTGAPKGAMQTQQGWIACVENVIPRLQARKGDRAISLLPPWHVFEQVIEYAFLYLGLQFMITDISLLKEDLKEFKPTIFPSVPRIWESVYNGIIGKVKKESAAKQKVFNFFLSVGATWHRWHAVAFGYDLQIEKPNAIASLLRRLLAFFVLLLLSPLKLLSKVIFKGIREALGGQMRVSLSGGSALPGVVDRFLSAVGLRVLEGYGMTETSAVISARLIEGPVSGTIGKPLDGYEIRLKNEQGVDVKHIPGAKGTLWVKSVQVMKGYYRRPELNDIVFDKDGFFDTGDLMMLTHRGELVFAGRAKDTIVLASGENLEPVPLEDRLLISDYIDQVMVVGDDKKYPAALIVPAFDRLKEHLPSLPDSRERWNENLAVRALFQNEIGRLLTREAGFKSFEIVPKDAFYIVPRPFDLETEMTKTLKMKRPVIKDHFQAEIDRIYK